jgi:hypothetical protein
MRSAELTSYPFQWTMIEFLLQLLVPQRFNNLFSNKNLVSQSNDIDDEN